MVKNNYSLLVICIIFIAFSFFVVFKERDLGLITSYVSVDVETIKTMYNSSDFLSGNALFILESGDFVARDDQLSLSVLKDNSVIIKKNITVNDMMSKVQNPPSLINKDGRLGYEGPSTITFSLQDVFSLVIMDIGNFNLKLEYINASGVAIIAEKEIVVNAQENGAEIKDVIFSVVEIVNNTVNFIDSDSFSKYEMVGCFVDMYNYDVANIKIYNPGGTLEVPYIEFTNDDINCLDDGDYVGYCGGVINVTDSYSGQWSCYIEISSAINTDSSISNVLNMGGSLPVWKGDFYALDINLDGSLNNLTLNLSDLFFDSDGDVLQFDSKGYEHIDIVINEGIVSFINTQNYEGIDEIEFVASDGLGEASSGIIALNIGNVDLIGCSADIECLVDEKCINGFCQKISCAMDSDCEQGMVCLDGDCVIKTQISCDENWQCSDWSQCVSGVQTKDCNDINKCGTIDSKPTIVQSCVTPKEEEDVQVIGEAKNEGSSNVISILILIMIVAGLLGFGLVLLYKKYSKKNGSVEEKKEEDISSNVKQPVLIKQEVQEKPKQEVQRQENKIDFKPIVDYIKKMQENGANIDDIKANLLKAGWGEQDIKKANDFMILEKFVLENREKGFDDDVIRKSLEVKGWNKDLIDGILGLTT